MVKTQFRKLMKSNVKFFEVGTRRECTSKPTPPPLKSATCYLLNCNKIIEHRSTLLVSAFYITVPVDGVEGDDPQAWHNLRGEVRALFHCLHLTGGEVCKRLPEIGKILGHLLIIKRVVKCLKTANKRNNKSNGQTNPWERFTKIVY